MKRITKLSLVAALSLSSLVTIANANESLADAFTNGKIKTRIQYENGITNGLYEEYNDKYLIKKCFYREGMHDGEYVECFPDGTVCIKASFIKGKKNGRCQKF